MRRMRLRTIEGLRFHLMGFFAFVPAILLCPGEEQEKIETGY
jgi:hypothetical protein